MIDWLIDCLTDDGEWVSLFHHCLSQIRHVRLSNDDSRQHVMIEKVNEGAVKVGAWVLPILHTEMRGK